MALTDKIKYLEHLLNFKFPNSEYLVVNSSWLSMMDLRANGDLDILISNKLWDQKFKEKSKDYSFGLPGKFEKKIRVHSISKGSYTSLKFVKSNDDLIYNHRVVIDDIPFINPKIYFLYKIERIHFNNTYIENLPWWIKLNFFKGSHKKYFLKRKKDLKDFKLIKSFFLSETHLAETWREKQEIDWGLNDRVLRGHML